MNKEYIFHGDCEHMGYISDNRSFICKIINMVYIYIYIWYTPLWNVPSGNDTWIARKSPNEMKVSGWQNHRTK